jgi:hypothetical protein
MYPTRPRRRPWPKAKARTPAAFGGCNLVPIVGGSKTPDRGPTIAMVVVEEVELLPAISNEESRFTVALQLVDAGHRQCDPMHSIEYSTTTSVRSDPFQSICIASYNFTDPPLFRPGQPLAIPTASCRLAASMTV